MAGITINLDENIKPNDQPITISFKGNKNSPQVTVLVNGQEQDNFGEIDRNQPINLTGTRDHTINLLRNNQFAPQLINDIKTQGENPGLIKVLGTGSFVVAGGTFVVDTTGEGVTDEIAAQPSMTKKKALPKVKTPNKAEKEVVSINPEKGGDHNSYIPTGAGIIALPNGVQIGIQPSSSEESRIDFIDSNKIDPNIKNFKNRSVHLLTVTGADIATGEVSPVLQGRVEALKEHVRNPKATGITAIAFPSGDHKALLQAKKGAKVVTSAPKEGDTQEIMHAKLQKVAEEALAVIESVRRGPFVSGHQDRGAIKIALDEVQKDARNIQEGKFTNTVETANAFIKHIKDVRTELSNYEKKHPKLVEKGGAYNRAFKILKSAFEEQGLEKKALEAIQAQGTHKTSQNHHVPRSELGALPLMANLPAKPRQPVGRSPGRPFA